MIISWRYSQKVKLLELDLCRSELLFEIINGGADNENLEKGKIYKIDISNVRSLDFLTIADEIEKQLSFYLYD